MEEPDNQTQRATRTGALGTLLWTLALGVFWMGVEHGRIVASATLHDPLTDLVRFLAYLPWQLMVFACIGLPLAALVRWTPIGPGSISWTRLGAALLAFLGPSAALGTYRLTRDPITALMTIGLATIAVALSLIALAAVGPLLPKRLRPGWPDACTVGATFIAVPVLSRASAPLRIGKVDGWDLIGMADPGEWITAIVATGLTLLWIARRHRPSSRGATALAAAIAAVTTPVSARSADTRPDVLVIVIDALRSDFVGDARTPHLNEIAAESLAFESAYSAANRTSRSMPVIFTSLSPAVVGESLSPSAKTIAEYAKESGYETLGISTNPHVSRFYGYDQGFDGFHDPTVAPDYLVMNPLKIFAQLAPATAYHLGLVSAQLYYPPASEVRSRAQAILRTTESPRFVYLHFMDLHGPYLPPKRFLPDSYRPEDFASYFDLLARLISGTLDEERNRPEFDNARQRYEAELRFADDEIGRIVSDLRSRGRWNDTLVWVLSDHGEAFGESGWIGHSGNNVFPTLLRVPMLLKPPRSSGLRPGRIAEPVSNYDVLPTTLALLGIEPTGPLFGTDIAKPENREAPRCLVSDSHHPDGRLVSCIQGRWQLEARVSRKSVSADPVALFDLDNDPTARRNLIGAHPEVVRELTQKLDAHLFDEQRLSIRSDTPTTDPEMLERLRSLGYLEE